MTNPLRRLPLLLLLVSQLLVLGVGGGAYLCLDQGGGARMRIAAEFCCESDAPSHAGNRTRAPDSEPEHGCRTCRDVGLAAESLATRSAADEELQRDAPAAPHDVERAARAGDGAARGRRARSRAPARDSAGRAAARRGPDLLIPGVPPVAGG